MAPFPSAVVRLSGRGQLSRRIRARASTFKKVARRWSGVWVYVGETGVTVNEGDVVEIEGEVVEYYGLTEIEPTRWRP